MQHLITKLIILISILLVSCSNHTPMMEPVGSTIGAGIGGKISRAMNGSDTIKTYIALSVNPEYISKSWKNKKTGHIYAVTPMSKNMEWKGRKNCRQYKVEAMIRGNNESKTGIACRQADGTWITVN